MGSELQHETGGSVNRCVNRSGGGLLVLACFDR